MFIVLLFSLLTFAHGYPGCQTPTGCLTFSDDGKIIEGSNAITTPLCTDATKYCDVAVYESEYNGNPIFETFVIPDVYGDCTDQYKSLVPFAKEVTRFVNGEWKTFVYAYLESGDKPPLLSKKGYTAVEILEDLSKKIYTDIYGMWLCRNCPHGMEPDPDDPEKCVPCKLGWGSSDGGGCVFCTPETEAVWEGVCSTCPAGKKLVISVSGNTCEDCKAGYYGNTGFSCEICPYNKISNPAATHENECFACPAGKGRKHNNGEEKFYCTDCTNQEYLSNGGCSDCPYNGIPTSNRTGCTACETSGQGPNGFGACEPCPAGTMSLRTSVHGNSGYFCPDCQAGQFQPEPGQTTCRDCSLGKKLNNEGSGCDECPIGHYGTKPTSLFGGNINTCAECPAGWWTTTKGLTSCTGCPAGKYLDVDECESCDYMYSSVQGSTSCVKCSLLVSNTFQKGEDKTQCVDCPAGFEPSTEGFPKNVYDKDAYPINECTACAPGKASEKGVSICEPCSAGKYFKSSTECEPCNAGFYSEDTATECTECPAGEISAGMAASCTVCAAGDDNKNGICDNEEGCTDITMFNYDSTVAMANDDGSCYPIIKGCLLESAWNYNCKVKEGDSFTGTVDPPCPKTNVTIDVNTRVFADNSSCTVAGCTDITMFNYDSTLENDDGSCYPIIKGCLLESAWNYNCKVKEGDSFTGTVDPPCPKTNVTIDVNTRVFADDSSCTAKIRGCTDDTMFGYNYLANTDDGSCTPRTYGCIDANALNYNSSANTDDGTCIAKIHGCMDPEAYNYKRTANFNTSCTPKTYGCKNDWACNYDEDANTADDSCLVPNSTACEYCVSYGSDGKMATDPDTNGNGFCDRFDKYACKQTGACNEGLQENGELLYGWRAMGAQVINTGCVFAQRKHHVMFRSCRDPSKIRESLEGETLQKIRKKVEIFATNITDDTWYTKPCGGRSDSIGYGSVDYNNGDSKDKDENSNGICDSQENVGCQTVGDCAYKEDYNMHESTLCNGIPTGCSSCDGDTLITRSQWCNDPDKCQHEAFGDTHIPACGTNNPLVCGVNKTPDANSCDFCAPATSVGRVIGYGHNSYGNDGPYFKAETPGYCVFANIDSSGTMAHNRYTANCAVVDMIRYNINGVEKCYTQLEVLRAKLTENPSIEEVLAENNPNGWSSGIESNFDCAALLETSNSAWSIYEENNP